MDKRQIMYRQFLCVIPVNCLLFMCGLQRGWIAPILHAAQDPHSELPMTSEQCSWMASLNYVTRGSSAILTSLLMDRASRSSILVFDALVFSGVWIAVYWSRDILVHYVIRLACGLCDGLLDAVSGIYVCENCSPEFRGTFFTIAILFLFAGHFVVFVLANYCSYSCIAIVYTVLGILTFLSTFLLVEPAQYLLMRGDAEKAAKTFAHLRDMEDASTVKEFEAIKKNIEEEKARTSSVSLYGSKEVVRSLRLVLIISFLSAECGYPVMTAFVTKLFSNSNAGLTAGELSMIYGALQLVSVATSSTIIHKFNRRTLLLFCCSAITLLHAGTATLYCVQSSYAISLFSSIIFVLLTVFSCLYAMFMFALIGILKGELLPQSVKMMGSGLSTLLLAMGSFINTRTFLPIAETLGMEVNFIVFSSGALIMAVYAYFDLPETRGKTLVEIQNELKGVRDNEVEFSHL